MAMMLSSSVAASLRDARMLRTAKRLQPDGLF